MEVGSESLDGIRGLTRGIKVITDEGQTRGMSWSLHSFFFTVTWTDDEIRVQSDEGREREDMEETNEWSGADVVRRRPRSLSGSSKSGPPQTGTVRERDLTRREEK